jgi:hypothetical protein
MKIEIKNLDYFLYNILLNFLIFWIVRYGLQNVLLNQKFNMMKKEALVIAGCYTLSIIIKDFILELRNRQRFNEVRSNIKKII